MGKKLSITLVHSPVGRPEPQRKTVEALGLRRMHHEVLCDDTPTIRGMVKKIQHLVSVQEVETE